jgi:cation diffusion facilitator CzcD-associated flavoprotein CzcO
VKAGAIGADVDAVVIGAGFAGLYTLHRLRDHVGLRVRVFDVAGGVGGTWELNRYPGARCDTESYAYCYSFSEELYQEWNWSGKYPTQPEILRYLNHVADRFDLRRDISLNTGVTGASFGDDQLWHVDTDRGEHITARFLITGVGLLAAAPHRPHLPGLETFAGQSCHTGDWPAEGIELDGKRVGVIGTGSSGVQTIPVVADTAAHLTVFQRTPQFALPARHDTIGPADLEEFKQRFDEIWADIKWSVGGFPFCGTARKSSLTDTPEERTAVFEDLWRQGGLRFVLATYQDLLFDRRTNDAAAEFIRDKIRARVNDPRTRELLLPCDHPFGAKRPVVENHYFETYNRDNVSLVDIHTFPIVQVTPTGITTEAGHHELDVIVFATGFDAVTGPLLRLNITGRDGVRLRDRWADGPASYLGLSVAGYPNMFTITGPGSTFGNMPVVIEHHVEWIADLIAHMDATGQALVEASDEAQRSWTELMAKMADRSVIPLADSWSTGANIPGKPRTVLFYLGSYGAYRKELDKVAYADYVGLDFTPVASVAPPDAAPVAR